ncbi:MAG: hypothetical protein PHV34_11825 [Verrucomicrobiae bacterium]|nr:hypothetical protein [Verrucomicrobiae bacterium]
MKAALAPTVSHAAAEREARGETVYRCGNLAYTKRGLVVLFAWMLWGDLCYTLMEAVVPSILPLKLRSLESSNWLIGAIMGTLPGVFSTTICPWVSFKSDRYRSKWGRRIPFIMWTLPFLTASLVLIGCSDAIGAWAYRQFFQGSGVRQAAVVIALLAVFAGLFDLFNMFVGSVYSYLFRDVVPEKALARFMAYFRLIGVLSSAAFNFFVFKYAESHMREIYLGAAALYGVGFTLMCLKVKERTYPPFPEQVQAPSLKRDLQTFAKESYSISFYWNIFLDNMLGSAGGCAAVFTIFFYKSMGLELDLFGKIAAVSGVSIAICLTFIGHYVDRWHPVRVAAYMAPLVGLGMLNSCVWIWVQGAPPPQLFFWATIVFGLFCCLGVAAFTASGGPRQMELFPAERYGQFCGAQALLVAGMKMGGGVVAGVCIDSLKHVLPDGDCAYRYIFVWQLGFAALALFFHCRAYRAWKRLGAESGYTPPHKSFNVRKLLAQAPSPGPSVGGAVNRQCAGLFLLALLGAWVFAAIFLVYFGLFRHEIRNTLVFLVQLILITALFPLYRKLLRFLEAP